MIMMMNIQRNQAVRQVLIDAMPHKQKSTDLYTQNRIGN